MKNTLKLATKRTPIARVNTPINPRKLTTIKGSFHVANLERKKGGSWRVDRASMRPLDIESLSLEPQCLLEALQEKSARTPMNERGEKEYVITREDVDAKIAQRMKQ